MYQNIYKKSYNINFIQQGKNTAFSRSILKKKFNMIDVYNFKYYIMLQQMIINCNRPEAQESL